MCFPFLCPLVFFLAYRIFNLKAIAQVEKIYEIIGITKRAIEKNISTLKKLDVVEREGSDKTGRWVIKP
jgi:predicted HTH transcriptional regulator